MELEITDITETDRDEVIRLGSRLHSADLDSQARVTLALAETDKEALEEILGPKLIPAAVLAHEKVGKVANDRTLAGDEKKSKTLAQSKQVRQTVQWRRKVIKLGSILARRGVKEAANLSRITSPDKSFGNLKIEVDDKVTLLAKHASRAPNPAYARSLAERGQAISKLLTAKDVAQELDIKNLPKKTREAYLYKGLLYLAVKQLNDAADGLDDDGVSRYNMGIYHRRSARRERGKADVEATPK